MLSRYVASNTRFFSGCRQYSSNIPRYLHDRPHPFIDHCMNVRDAAENSSLQAMPSSTVVEAFTVSARNGKSNEVFMGNDTSLPCCTCKEFQRTKWLCKHFFVVFKYFSEWTPLLRWMTASCLPSLPATPNKLKMPVLKMRQPSGINLTSTNRLTNSLNQILTSPQR